MTEEFDLSEEAICECGHKKAHHQHWGRTRKITKCVYDYLNCNDGAKRTCRCKKFKLAGELSK